jgi:hypothetical protein
MKYSKSLIPLALLAAAVLSIATSRASAQFTAIITVDENGVGTFSNSLGASSPLPFAIQADPGPGGLPAALTYGLLSPPGLTAGDLLIVEPGLNGQISDIIRFNPAETIAGTTGALVFYSDNLDGADALADTGFPAALYDNNIARVEVGGEGQPNGLTYTPTPGQPGFVTGSAGPVTYVFQSDVPEPSSLALVLMPLAISVRRRRPR